jgi:hypothetical protein
MVMQIFLLIKTSNMILTFAGFVDDKNNVGVAVDAFFL